MKAAIIQAPYSVHYEDSDRIFAHELALLEECDESLDLIVLPEYCDIPALPSSLEEHLAGRRRYTERILSKARETAKRCNAVVFINCIDENENGGRNTTFAIDRQGEIVGRYYKEHLTALESNRFLLDSGYTLEPSEPYVLEVEGVRYGFLTCYDFYFYESYPRLALQNVDVIIGCSHQRSDSHDMTEIICRFCAFHCNAHLLRATVTFGEDAPTGGASMIVSPRGEVLADLKNHAGIATAEFDPRDKFYKPAGYGNPPAAHYEYIEKGRRPWKYRPAGPFVCLPDSLMPYPRVCAHRGFNTVAPENSLPAFGAAVALGAEEIEFDLWVTKDGEIVSIHDSDLERVSDGCGKVWEHTYEELLQYDFGIKFSSAFAGLKILKLEEILSRFACHVIMNIHLKTADNSVPFGEEALLKIIRLIRRYDCQKHVYFMSGNDPVQQQLLRLAPEIARCQGAGDDPWRIVERAIENRCQKVQLFLEYINDDMLRQAHENGIRCNYFFSDDPEAATMWVKRGVDTVLTNDYQRVALAIGTKK